MIGQTFGAYEAVAKLGEGGMGEVYRARDPRLGRDVAIKIIPRAVAADADRLARFEREARAVAALSHPNILSIFEFSTHDAQPFVVMELLEGETLRARLADGPLPVRKATDIATQIARGLAAAHDRNIVHRDLKPENIFLLADGHVKILDFGLAKTAVSDGDSAGIAAAETRAALTGEGTILGTVGYMAPEQIKGAVADARMDLFALGVVLHEMLSGAPPFRRDTAAETTSAILRDDAPDLARLRPDLPAALVSIVHHALEKNAVERFQSARDVAFALEALSGSRSGAASPAAAAEAATQPAPARRLARERLVWTVATLALAATAAWLALGRVGAGLAAPPVQRSSILLPPGLTFRDNLPHPRRLAISPDGRRVAYVVGPRSVAEATLHIYSMDTGTSVSVLDSAGARSPFWSPDSRTLAFIQSNRIMAVDATGGRPTLRAALTDTISSAAWGSAGAIVVGLGNRSLGVLRAGAADVQKLTVAPDADHLMGFPAWLPDGRRFVVSMGSVPRGTAGLYRTDVDSAPPERLLEMLIDRDSGNFAYVDGWLLNVRDQMIVARAVDSNGAPASGDPVTLGGLVDTSERSAAAFSASPRVLAYQPVAGPESTRLVWYSRSGARLGEIPDDGLYGNLELSPDGSQMLAGVADPMTRLRDIWTVELRRGVRSRVTSDANADARSAIWTHDGRNVIYRSVSRDLYVRPIGSGAPQPIQVDGISKDPLHVSPDGRFLVYRASGATTRNDVWIKPLNPVGDARPLLATTFTETAAQISPDGRWMAYVSDESGEAAVYVTDFPAGRDKRRISPAQGEFPRWRHDGLEIYYLSADRSMMAVPVRATRSGFEADPPVSLFQTEANRAAGSQFIVTPDGRFLVNTEVLTEERGTISLVFNWQSLLRK